MCNELTSQHVLLCVFVFGELLIWFLVYYMRIIYELHYRLDRR